jgi:hypothetical protein
VSENLGRVQENAEDLALACEDLLEDRVAAVVVDLSHPGHGERSIQWAPEGPMSVVARRTVETNGISVHVAEQGHGALVLICHGFPES